MSYSSSLVQAPLWIIVFTASIAVVSATGCRDVAETSEDEETIETPADEENGHLGRLLEEEITREELAEAYRAGTVRVYRSGEAVTTDYIPDRLNVELDNEGRIVALWMDSEGAPWDHDEEQEERYPGERDHNDRDADPADPADPGDAEEGEGAHEADGTDGEGEGVPGMPPQEHRNEQTRNDDEDTDTERNDDEPLSGAELTERYAGKQLGTEVTREEIEQASSAVQLRVHQYGGPVTMDFVEGRVNVALGDDERIKVIWRDEEGYPRD